MLFYPSDQPPSRYDEILAWSNKIFVTCDSINMISEALASGAEVFLLGHESVKAASKVEAFTSSLVTGGNTKLPAFSRHMFLRALPEVKNHSLMVAENLFRLMKEKKRKLERTAGVWIGFIAHTKSAFPYGKEYRRQITLFSGVLPAGVVQLEELVSSTCVAQLVEFVNNMRVMLDIKNGLKI